MERGKEEEAGGYMAATIIPATWLVMTLLVTR